MSTVDKPLVSTTKKIPCEFLPLSGGRSALPSSLQPFSHLPMDGNNLSVQQWMNRQGKVYIQS